MFPLRRLVKPPPAEKFSSTRVELTIVDLNCTYVDLISSAVELNSTAVKLNATLY